MIKILSAEQIRDWDKFTIENTPISSLDLMEKAANAFVNEVSKKLNANELIDIVCGPGNNGGDGFAIARLLMQNGFQVHCHLIDFGAKLSNDCRENYKQFQKLGQVTIVKEVKALSLKGEVLIDAIFGSGLNRPASGLAAEVIQCINQHTSKKVAVDIPSGLFADKVDLSGEVVVADWTITFQVPKLTFLIPESGYYAGEWTSVDIGLLPAFLTSVKTDYYLLERSDVKTEAFKRGKYDHKGDYGKLLMVAGSLGKMGAAYLCSKAALKSGAGLVTVHIPKHANTIIQTLLPEAMVILDSDEEVVTKIGDVDGFDAIGIGPGLGQHSETRNMLASLFTSFNKPMAIDADALNLIASNKKMKTEIPKGSVLTPHVGEFNRLFGEQENGLERIKQMKEFACAKEVVMVLKGAHTAIAAPDGKVYFNTTGNAGMATGGCGDVLTGIVSSFLAQGMDSVTSATNAVYIHGWAADAAKNKVGKTSLMASDLLCALPEIFSNVENSDFI